MMIKCIPTAATMSARGEDALTSSMSSHIEGCPRCRDELAAHRSVTEQLGEMRYIEFSAPRDTLQMIMAEIGPYAVPDMSARTDHRVGIATAAALVTATAACGTAVLVRIYRHRAA